LSPNFPNGLIIATDRSDVEALRQALSPLPKKLVKAAFEATGCRIYISPTHPELRRGFGLRHRLHFGPRPDMKGESWERFPFFNWGFGQKPYIHLPVDTLDPERALAIHEVGGHLVDFLLSDGRYGAEPWHRLSPKMRKPLDQYASDEYERWACAMQAFYAAPHCLPTCNREHLQRAEPELHAYIEAFLKRWS
jgi:hypothetical protein